MTSPEPTVSGFARRAREPLATGGLDVFCHEPDDGHHIDRAHRPAARAWLAATIDAGAPARDAVRSVDSCADPMTGRCS